MAATRDSKRDRGQRQARETTEQHYAKLRGFWAEKRIARGDHLPARDPGVPMPDTSRAAG